MEYKEESFLTYVPSGEMAVEFSSDSSCSSSRHIFRIEIARKESQQLQKERERSEFLRMQKDGLTCLHPEYRHIVKDSRTEDILLQHNITVDSLLASVPDNEGTRGDGVDVKDNSGRIVGRRFISQRITCYPIQKGSPIIPFPSAFTKQLKFLLSCDDQLPTMLKEPMHMAASYINCAENDPKWSGLVYSCCHFMWLWNAGSPFHVHSGRICVELPFGSNGKYTYCGLRNTGLCPQSSSQCQFPTRVQIATYSGHYGVAETLTEQHSPHECLTILGKMYS